MNAGEALQAVFDYAPTVIAVAAIVTATTPTPADDGVLAVIRKVFDFLAMNWGHAKNAPK